MEVLQRLGAQAPAERGHEGSRACIWLPHPHARRTPVAERDEKSEQGESVVAVARRLATCAATGAGGEQQPGRDAHVLSDERSTTTGAPPRCPF